MQLVIEETVNVENSRRRKHCKEFTGTFCDRWVSVKCKQKCSRLWWDQRVNVAYVIETLPLNKAEVDRMRLIEMEMLRWMWSITTLVRVPDERIRVEVKVANPTAITVTSEVIWPCSTKKRQLCGKTNDNNVGWKKNKETKTEE